MSPPASVTISPTAPTVGQSLTATATGGGAGTTPTYTYQWSRSTDGGTTWSAWGNTGATLAASNTAAGDHWKAEACAVSGTTTSTYTVSAAVTINAATVTPPASVTITPGSPTVGQNLTATATGGGVSGTTPSYAYQWSRSTDGGTTWSAWGNAGSVLLGTTTAAGDKWKAEACCVSGSNESA